MTSIVNSQLIELSRRVSENVRDHGTDIVTRGDHACRLLLLWLEYLRNHQLTGTADSLLHATESAAREGLACLALGLVRPALASLRSQIDMCLAWIYFKDHPIEWRRVQETGDGFRMKAELLRYLGDSYTRFAARFGLLRDCRNRQLEDPFRLLSAHIHGQSELVLPSIESLEDIIGSAQAQFEAVDLQSECSEFISDVFWSIFADRWAGLPSELKHNLEVRFKSPDQRFAFFA